jgi:hypothetical protein
VRGVVLRVDRFGNLVTNIDRKSVERLGRGRISIDAGGQRVERLVATYAELPPTASARSSAAPITWSWPRRRRARRTASACRAAPSVKVTRA